MSYRITLQKDYLHLQFIGHVNGLQIMQVINDDTFLPNLDKLDNAIFDFSTAEEVSLSMEEVKSFGTIGKVETNFIDSLNVVIVLSHEGARAKAMHFIESVGAENWHFDVALTAEEALKLLQIK